MVYRKNDGRLESKNVAIKIAEAVTSAKRLLMTIDDHYMYKSYSIIYRSNFQSKTEVRLIPKQVIIGSHKFGSCSKKGCFIKCSQNQEENDEVKSIERIRNRIEYGICEY